jgi:hypothetical protein
MAERLGEALLDLRTNDAGFSSGVEQAKGKAQQLGAQLDRTSGSSAKLATEMVATGRSAQQLGAGFERAGQQVTAAAGAQRAGMQQLSFQIGDIATMYSLGARPAQIFASQIGQVTQAVQMMSGGTSRAAAFLGGPWGIALTAATIVLAPFVGKLFEAEDALQGVEFASDKLSDAQGILGSVIDRTTGQINTQSQALLALARAQAAAGMVGAMQRQAAARSELSSISQGGLGDLRIEGSMGGARVVRANNGQDVVELFRSGRLSAPQAEQQLRLRMNNGMISQDAYFRAAQAITSFDVEGANVAVFRDTLAGLDGDAAAARRVFGAQGAPRGGPRRSAGSGPRARSEAEIAGDFSDQSLSLERQTLQARLQLATTADERAEIQDQLLNLEREQRIAEVEASDLGAARKAALIAQIEALLGTAPAIDEQGNMILSANRGLEGQLITRERLIQIERETEALAQEQFNAQRDALQLQLQLADTDAERKAIALKLLEAEDAHLRSRLTAVLLSETANEAEQQRAQIARDALDATAGARRAATARQNETGTERYLRALNATPGQINEALEGIQIDGLEALNDGLTEAIMGAESLGNVFKRVADQIIADLIRIAIQQAIIKPLANSLFGGGGGGAGAGGGDVFGSIFSSFAGFFATGGTIPTGQFGIVGEEGPEIAVAGPGGLGILSNSDSRKVLGGGGTNVSIPISIDATGADAAAIARLNAKIDQLKDELPGRIVTTVRDARDRRFL